MIVGGDMSEITPGIKVGPVVWGINSKRMAMIWAAMKRIDRLYGIMLGRNLFLGIIIRDKKRWDGKEDQSS